MSAQRLKKDIMKLSKFWMCVLIAGLIVNVLSLSYIVANKKGQHQPYTMTRLEYVKLQMKDIELSWKRIYSDLGSVILSPGASDADMHIEITWNPSVQSIGLRENTMRDRLVNELASLLKIMHRSGNWDPNPTILCIQEIIYMNKDRNEFKAVEINRIQKRVSTP